MGQEIIGAASGQKDAVIGSAVTIGGGALEWIGVLNGILATVSLTVGIVLGLILISIRLKERRLMNEREHTRRKEDKSE